MLRVKLMGAVRHVLLSLGWLVLAVATYQAAQVKMNSILYDPFKILGISSVCLTIPLFTL